MLVYANFLSLDPPDGVNSIITLYSEWLRLKNNSLVDPGLLASGILNFRLSKDAILSSFATVDGDGSPVYPYFYHSSYLHPDYKVEGRSWITEIGLRQFSKNDRINCSFALSTSESSAKVSQSVRPTYPRIFRSIAETCRPADSTLGLKRFALGENRVSAFMADKVFGGERDYPLVLLGPSASENFGLSSSDVASVVIGLAQVVTFKTERAAQVFADHIGPGHSVSADSIRVIPPVESSSFEEIPRTSAVGGFREDGTRKAKTYILSDILSEITSYTNERKYREHITAERVKTEKLNVRFRKISRTLKKTMKKTQEIPVYEELLEEAAKETQNMSEENEALKLEVQAAYASLGKAESALQANRLLAPGSSSTDLADAIHALGMGKIKLEQALMLATSFLHPARFTVLNSAVESAGESDRGGFKHGAKALELLIKLGGGYWEVLKSGRGDQQAKAVFGKTEFASKDKRVLSSAGRKLRTFDYKGKMVFMERHLRYGNKDSLAETLRVHFFWDEGEKKIVIGHCGKHLNF